jgi:hypothetical protein
VSVNENVSEKRELTVTTKVVTGKVRLSFAHVFEPHSSLAEQPEKYSTTILIPKSDRKTLEAIKAAQAAAIEAGKQRHFGGKVPLGIKSTLHDGDEEADLDVYPENAGHYYMSVSSKTRPGVVDRDLNPILDSTEVYSGCYARVSINCFAYNVSGNRGTSFGLNHVQKLADGEALGGARSRAEDDFSALDDDEDALL